MIIINNMRDSLIKMRIGWMHPLLFNIILQVLTVVVRKETHIRSIIWGEEIK